MPTLDPEQARAALEARLPEMLRFLRELVEINSFSGNRDGVNANASRILYQFSKLGFTARTRPCADADAGDHLVLDSGGSGPVIALISHLDTVFTPAEEDANNFIWQEEGERIYGPGVYDIKGGTAMIWLLLTTLAELEPQWFASIRWMILWNAAEERLVPDFADFCLAELPPETRACLVFEGDSEQGGGGGFRILEGRKGIAKFNLNVYGRGAHAGSVHRAGANAIHQLARIIDRLQGLTDYEKGVTVNVGFISGGSVANRVPHEAHATLEMRAYDEESFAATREKILAMAGEGDVIATSDAYPCRVEIGAFGEVPPWPGGEGTQKLVAIWKAAAETFGFPLQAHRRGGISDGNYLAHHFPVLDGLGPCGGNAHASERSADGSKLPEFVHLGSWVNKALLNLAALYRLGQP